MEGTLAYPYIVVVVVDFVFVLVLVVVIFYMSYSNRINYSVSMCIA